VDAGARTVSGAAPTALTWLAVAAGGAGGSVLRYAVGLWLARPSAAFPFATLAVNVLGAFLLGVFARVFAPADADPVLRAALTIGFCGGFTTFSTFSAELVTLAQDGRLLRAAAYATLSLLGGVLATLAGLALGGRLLVRG
jgi:CrcB protein